MDHRIPETLAAMAHFIQGHRRSTVSLNSSEKELKLQADPQENKIPTFVSALWTVSLQASRARLKAGAV